jgi:hypothetical protein
MPGLFVETPLACNIQVFDDEQRIRHGELLQLLDEKTQEVQEREDGYALRLPAESNLIPSAAEWIMLERMCCPFLRFTLDVASDSKPIWLRLAGREGVKDFIREELGLLQAKR